MYLSVCGLFFLFSTTKHAYIFLTFPNTICDDAGNKQNIYFECVFFFPSNCLPELVLSNNEYSIIVFNLTQV